jgi:proteic killer suppression protein
MIKSFKCKETKKIWNEVFSKKLPHDIQKKALAKLFLLDSADTLSDLKVPPNNKLEALGHDRQGQHSIRINDQYRICFRWFDNKVFDVEIVDYH